MKKRMRVALIVLASLSGITMVTLLVSAAVYSPAYMARILLNGESKITDYRIFPERAIARSDRPYTYEVRELAALPESEIGYRSGAKVKTARLHELLAANGTTSCIVVHGDRVVYEAYYNGHSRDSVETSFSSVKSIDSLLIGMAIEDGFIDGVQDPLPRYLPEFAGTSFADITLEQLLLMRSKIDYTEGLAWFSDDAKTYYMPDLRKLVLNHLRVDTDYSGKFHYNNYHPLLLGLVIERATGMSVANYFQRKIWQKVGAEHDASWSLDSKASGFEKMESGLNFRTVDYAKIGSMLLHGGQWNGYAIISKEWIDASTISPQPLRRDDTDSDFFNTIEVGYRYMWYSAKNGAGGYDYYAAGKYGQYLYVSPENDVVIVRTGFNEGEVDRWPDVLSKMAELARRLDEQRIQ